MPAASEGLVAGDPIVARFFYLDLDGEKITLSGVSGLDIELEVVSVQVNGQKGKQDHVKTLGGGLKVPDISLTRMAPADSSSDPIWKWFTEIRDKGFSAGNRNNERKNGSIIMYDSAANEVARFNFVKAWPSKISTDALSTDSNEAVKENITLVCERIDRIK
jgi:phage tail-like protein